MADKFFAIDDQTYLFPTPVRNAYLADTQNLLNAQIPPAVQSAATTAVNAAIPGAVSAAVTPAVNAAVPPAVAAALPFKMLAGTGIDPTGVADSTAAVNAFFSNLTDGTTVIIPNGAIINLTATVSIGKRIRLTGAGELRWTSGISASIALYIGADGTVIEGIRCTNTSGAPAQTGNKQYGIYIDTHRVKILHCWVQGFQQAITVSAYGEWHDFAIIGNTVLDVPGSGDGAANTTGNNGEDRGDGIVSWGAAGVIANNRVVAAAGADARIGIHCEGLANLEATPYAHSSALTTITGNTITGQFRRGIVSESVNAMQITGNSIADPTWWGIALINSIACTVTGNTVKWTRTNNDNQGAAWSPRRSAVMVYGSGSWHAIANNTLWVASGAVIQNGISIQTNSTAHADYILINGNVLVDGTQAMSTGIHVDGGANSVRNLRVLNNTISGYTTMGVYLWTADDFEVSNNQLIANQSFNTKGIRAENSNTSAKIMGNTIGSSPSSTAIYCYQRNLSTFVVNNVINQASVGIDLYGCAAATVNSNLFAYVTTKTTNLPAGAITVGNN